MRGTMGQISQAARAGNEVKKNKKKGGGSGGGGGGGGRETKIGEMEKSVSGFEREPGRVLTTL